MATTKNYFNDITFLKAIATLFITWFHFKWSVPDAYQSLFFGGGIGNSIFFFCSGYLLSFKAERYPGDWLVKKYFRIMPAIWITLILMLFCSFLRFGTFEGYPALEWFYPMRFWFVRAILFYFLVIYIVCKINKCMSQQSPVIAKTLLWSVAVIFLLIHFSFYFAYVDKTHVVLDEGGVKCWFYWFLFFVWGYYARNYGDLVEKRKEGSWLSIIGAMFSIVLFFAYKRIAPFSPILVMAQCVFIPAFLVVVVIAFRRLAKFLMTFNYSDKAKSAITLLSNITLEVYLVQMYIIRWLMPEMPFPINVAVIFIIILVVGYIVHTFATWLNSKIKFLY